MRSTVSPPEQLGLSFDAPTPSASPPPRLSPTALSNHLGCGHGTLLDRARAAGLHAAPSGFDPDRALRIARGLRHEARYVEQLRARGLDVEDLAGPASTAAHTRDAMARGASVIVQAPLESDDAAGSWHGRADVLMRVELAEHVAAPPWGAWCYEVHDTKLAHDTRAGTLLQLALYSEWLGALQGLRPTRFHVVMPGDPLRVESHRLADVDAYVRWAHARFADAIATPVDPEQLQRAVDPRPHCEVCRWWRDCQTRRAEHDHLSLVAGVSRSQIQELRSLGIDSLTALASRHDALPPRPRHGAFDSYERMHHQARVQLEGRLAQRPIHELLDVPDEVGFGELPAPRPGDLFLDFEGARHVEPDGCEYLFGLSWHDDGGDRYAHRWAFTPGEERAALGWLLGEIEARLAVDPEIHVHHFGAYEATALRRMGARWGEHMDAIDRLLRGRVLVDLHAIVRRTLRASVESYSIKCLEPHYGLVRAAELPEARTALRSIEAALELGDDPRAVPEAERELVRSYNRDDCVSVRALRDWLESLRVEREQALGRALPRPTRPDAAANEKVEARNQAIAELAAALREGVPDDVHAQDDEQRARTLLAELLSYHRREDAATWWDYYRLAALDEDDAIDDREAIAGLALESTRSDKKSTILRLRFPPQELTLKVGDEVHVQTGRGSDKPARRFGKVFAVDRAAGWIELRAGEASWSPGSPPPPMVFRHAYFDTDAKASALQELARAWLGRPPVDDAPRSWAAARTLLLRAPPRLRDGGPLPRPGEDTVTQACRVMLQLDRSVLPVQGPPGTGKTHTGAEMILHAWARGLRVGVTAGGHAAIRNLLATVIELGKSRGALPRLAHRTDDPTPSGDVTILGDTKAAVAAWAARAHDVLGATPFFWARSELADSIDVLFVDEAGQLSLADTLAVCGAAKSVVLLGDPQQLQQPCKASHPGGAEVSALRYLLGDAQTIADDRGIFLGTTWRLPPGICTFTSQLFYEGKLIGVPALGQRALLGATRFAGHGIWRVAVPHDGCSVRAPAEVETIAEIVGELLGGGVRWRDANGIEAPLRAHDILVVAPYNAQVDDLTLRLRPLGVTKVGTVDRFQGQQAPVVIWSMTSSTADDAPRGLGFLYDGFRLNVATSRAKVACIVVGSPSVFDVDCRSAEDMRLVNRWCALAEHAREPGSDTH